MYLKQEDIARLPHDAFRSVDSLRSAIFALYSVTVSEETARRILADINVATANRFAGTED